MGNVTIHDMKIVQITPRSSALMPRANSVAVDKATVLASQFVAVADLEMPVLFIGARYDYVCETATSALAQPMRASCSNLSEAIVDSGHWMAQEKPREVNALVAGWLARKVPELWPFADLLRNL